MRIGGAVIAAIGGLATFGPSGRAEAQAIGFNPTVSSLPNGVGLSVTPAVTADRRYVRLSINAGFQTIDGFQNFPVPGAVSGGGGRGLGVLGGIGGIGAGGGAAGGVAAGGGGGGGLVVVSGMNGPVGSGIPGDPGGMASSMGLAGYESGNGGPGFGNVYAEDWTDWRPSPKRSKFARPRTTRSKAAAPKPVAATPKKKP